MVPPQVDGRGRQNSIVRCFRPARCQSRAAQRLGDGVIAHQRRHALEVRGLPGQFSETLPAGRERKACLGLAEGYVKLAALLEAQQGPVGNPSAPSPPLQ
jgi:hypothetical protein